MKTKLPTMLLAGLLLTGLLLAACPQADDPGDDPLPRDWDDSCSYIAQGAVVCTEYTGSAFTQQSVDATCSANTGIIKESCPVDNILGYCYFSAGTPDEYFVNLYDGADYSMFDAMFACNGLGGQWLPNNR